MFRSSFWIIVIGGIIGFSIYCYLLWRMGYDFRKQELIDKELERQKKNLKSGYRLQPKWYELKKKSKARRTTYIVIAVLIVLAALYLSFVNDLRIHYVLGYGFAAISPAYLGYKGVIPIPGIKFND